jgi:hypothetical protein
MFQKMNKNDRMKEKMAQKASFLIFTTPKLKFSNSLKNSLFDAREGC